MISVRWQLVFILKARSLFYFCGIKHIDVTFVVYHYSHIQHGQKRIGKFYVAVQIYVLRLQVYLETNGFRTLPINLVLTDQDDCTHFLLLPASLLLSISEDTIYFQGSILKKEKKVWLVYCKKKCSIKEGVKWKKFFIPRWKKLVEIQDHKASHKPSSFFTFATETSINGKLLKAETDDLNDAIAADDNEMTKLDTHQSKRIMIISLVYVTLLSELSVTELHFSC